MKLKQASIEAIESMGITNRYGWLPDLPDYRDISYSAVTPVRETLPKPPERTLGGHAVLAVGYEDKAKRFIVGTHGDRVGG